MISLEARRSDAHVSSIGKGDMPVRLLFLNTRDRYGADVAVHLMLMKHFLPAEVKTFVISNSEAEDAEEMRARFAEMPHVTTRFLPLGRPARALAMKGKLGKALAYGPSVASLVKIAAFVRANRIQVVHSTDRPRDASYAGLLGMLTQVISVVHVHAPVVDVSGPSLWGMRKTSALFAVSESIRRDLIARGLGADRIHTLHNAVDADHFDPDRALPACSLREQFGIPMEAPLIGIAARMNPWKGQHELIDAVSSLRETIPALHLIIVGDDTMNMRADFERRARDGGVAERVHFGGFHSDIRPFLHELDLFVHPSQKEPFGLAIVEAMSMRKAVIACGTGGVPEIITHGVDGWLVEEGSAAAVAKAIEALLNDRELRHRMGERARQTVRERFTPRQQCSAAAQWYTKLIAAA